MKLALIPARGGSKRIPRKNIRSFAGQPIIAYSIAAAQASGLFDAVVVSTDDEEVAAIARGYGAETPFMRPADLADDQTTTLAVINHALTWFNNRATPVRLACCIYATAPFIRVADIVTGLHRLEEEGADFCLPITTFPFPIQRAVKVTADQRLAMFHPEYLLTRSQDLEESYHDAGQFVWGRGESFMQNRSVFGPGTVPVVIPRYRVQDIDTPEDWERAELLYKVLSREGQANKLPGN